MEKLLELKDICLIPSTTNNGIQVNKIDYFINDGLEVTGITRSLPIFTLPTESIVDSRNWKIWQDNGIKPILPSTEKLEVRLEACCYIFSSFSIQELKNNFISQDKRGGRSQFHIHIDSENGHELMLLDLCHKLKQYYGQQMIIMIGNVCNPETYINCSKANIDYVRVGISESFPNKDKYGFYYPMASLLSDLNLVKNKACIGLKTPMIVANNIKRMSEIPKAIALGADYVMIGEQFSSLLEAAETIYKRSKNQQGEEIIEEVNPENLINLSYNDLINLNLERQYYVSDNKSLNSQKMKLSLDKKSVGASWKWVPVNRSISDWILEFKNYTDYGFTMTDSLNWKEFKNKVKYGRIE